MCVKYTANHSRRKQKKHFNLKYLPYVTILAEHFVIDRAVNSFEWNSYWLYLFIWTLENSLMS